MNYSLYIPTWLEQCNFVIKEIPSFTQHGLNELASVTLRIVCSIFPIAKNRSKTRDPYFEINTHSQLLLFPSNIFILNIVYCYQKHRFNTMFIYLHKYEHKCNLGFILRDSNDVQIHSLNLSSLTVRVPIASRPSSATKSQVNICT